jgi:hypothetical protein
VTTLALFVLGFVMDSTVVESVHTTSEDGGIERIE